MGPVYSMDRATRQPPHGAGAEQRPPDDTPPVAGTFGHPRGGARRQGTAVQGPSSCARLNGRSGSGAFRCPTEFPLALGPGARDSSRHAFRRGQLDRRVRCCMAEQKKSCFRKNHNWPANRRPERGAEPASRGTFDGFEKSTVLQGWLAEFGRPCGGTEVLQLNGA